MPQASPALAGLAVGQPHQERRQKPAPRQRGMPKCILALIRTRRRPRPQNYRFSSVLNISPIRKRVVKWRPELDQLVQEAPTQMRYLRPQYRQAQPGGIGRGEYRAEDDENLRRQAHSSSDCGARYFFLATRAAIASCSILSSCARKFVQVRLISADVISCGEIIGAPPCASCRQVSRQISTNGGVAL